MRKYVKVNFIVLQLNPSDKAIAADWEKDLSNAKEFVRKLNVIVTNKDKEPEPEPEKEESEVS